MSDGPLTTRLACLKIAADLLNDVQRPDANAIVETAKIFEAYASGTAQASERQRKPQK